MSDFLIGIACEDRGHFTVITRLVDDALVERHSWLDGVVESCRRWRGVHDHEDWYKYDPADARDLRPITIDGRVVSIHGYIGGERLKLEAGMWRRVLMLFARLRPRPDVVVLARDMDGRMERRSGLEQVRAGIRWPFAVVAATPDPEIEAWRVAGFVSRNRKEGDLLTALCKELSFDPTTESHRLTSHPNDATTDAKRVLARLCGGETERLDACLAEQTLLRHRGQRNGLQTFLDEVAERIVSRFQTAP